MNIDYAEAMAREYAELLKAREQVKTTSLKVPSEEKEEFLRLVKAQFSALKYLQKFVKNPVKNRLLLKIDAELSEQISGEKLVKRTADFHSPEDALSFLIDHELTKLEKADGFLQSEASFAKKYLILTLCALLAF